MARVPDRATVEKMVADFEALLADMAEEITLADVKNNPWLRRLVVAADDLTNRVEYRAHEWAKSQ